MDSQLNGCEKYLKEIEDYRLNYFYYVLDKYTTNSEDDFLIDIQTFKVIKCKDTKRITTLYDILNDYYCEPDIEPIIPVYGTVTNYSCEPAQRLREKLDCFQEEGSDTSQSKLLEYAQQLSRKAKKSLTSNYSIHPIDDLSFSSDKSKVSEQDPKIHLRKSKIGKEPHNNLLIADCFEANVKWGGKAQQLSRKEKKCLRSDCSILKYELGASKTEAPVDDLSFSSDKSKVSKKDCNIRLRKSKIDLLFSSDKSKVSEKDPKIRLRKSKIAIASSKAYGDGTEVRRKSGKFLNTHGFLVQKIELKDLLISSDKSKVSEKDPKIRLRKSKIGKPNIISVRRNPAFKRNISFLQNIPADDVSINSTESSNSINCSSKSNSNIYVKNEQTVQKRKTRQGQLKY